MVRRVTEHVQTETQWLLRDKGLLPPETWTDDERWEHLANNYRLASVAETIPSQLDVIQKALNDPARRSLAIEIIRHLAARKRDNREVQTVIAGMLLPHRQECQGHFRFDRTLQRSLLLSLSRLHHEEALAWLRPAWQALLSPQTTLAVSHEWDLLEYAVHHEDADVRSQATTILSSAFPADLNAADLLADWKRGLFTHLQRIREIEALRPNERICSTLMEEFGIRNFGRYPARVLIEQFDERDSHQPYGLMAIADDDHNGAFDNLRDTSTSIFDGARQRGVLTRIVEFRDGQSMARRLLRMKERYLDRAPDGAGHRMRFGLLDVHGGTHSVHPGRQLTMAHLGTQKTRSLLQSCFEPGAWVTLQSCSTGKEDDGVAATLSQAGLRVVGPSMEASSTIKVQDDTRTGIRLAPKYIKGAARVFEGGQRVDTYPEVTDLTGAA